MELAKKALTLTPLAPVVAALQHVKGCGFVTALSFAAEVGDFSRFRSGRRVTSEVYRFFGHPMER